MGRRASIRLYGELQLPEIAQHLKNAEAFLKDRPEDPDLLLTVGRLSFRNQLWGKARSYLETSLAIRPAAETCEALGQLMERIGDKEAAAKAFQRGLAMRTEGARRLPKLSARSVSRRRRSQGASRQCPVTEFAVRHSPAAV